MTQENSPGLGYEINLQVIDCQWLANFLFCLNHKFGHIWTQFQSVHLHFSPFCPLSSNRPNRPKSSNRPNQKENQTKQAAHQSRHLAL